MNVCEPVLERYAIHDSYACRTGKGMHAAVLRAQAFTRRYQWYLKLDSTVLEEELVKAKQSLQKARGILSTGYDRSEGLLNLAGQIANIADDLCAEMERMREPGPRRRRQTQDESGS